MVWMAAFHFGFDLNHFGFIRAELLHRPVVDRAARLHRQPVPVLRRRRPGDRLGAGPVVAALLARWAQVAGCAVLVCIGSWLMFPRSWISFGVLHGIAVMLIVARLAAPLGRWLWPLGLVAIAAAAARAAPVLRHALDQLGRPRHAQAGDRGLRAGAAVAGRDAGGAWRPGTGCCARRPRWLAGAAAARRCAARAARPLEPELLHAAPAGADRRCCWPGVRCRAERAGSPGRRLPSADDARSCSASTPSACASRPRRARSSRSTSTPRRRDARMRQFVDRAEAAGARLVDSDDKRLQRLAGTHRHQGVVAQRRGRSRAATRSTTCWTRPRRAATAAACWCSTASPTRTTSAPACAWPTAPARMR